MPGLHAHVSQEGADQLGLQSFLVGKSIKISDHTFPGGSGRWEIRRSQFRQAGIPHQLLVLSDLTQTLREEERLAWRRLIQVLRHEINNSLAPIDSLAGSLAILLSRNDRPTDWEHDMGEGLSIIQNRSKALNRFMTAYTRLTQLPKPRLEDVEITSMLQRVANLETRKTVNVVVGPILSLRLDGDQIEQLLINLVRNAVDACPEMEAQVSIGWTEIKGVTDPRLGASGGLEIWVEDEGQGLSSTENLFVPFFTTKPGGSGIGLALCRQIAEAHGGHLSLANRTDRTGCRATVFLPQHIE